MPPWGAVKGFRDLAPDGALTEPEIQIVAAWVVGGAPEGDSALLPLGKPLRPDLSATSAIRVAITACRNGMKQPFPPRRTGEVTPNSLHTPLYCRQLYIHGRALDSAAPPPCIMRHSIILGGFVNRIEMSAGAGTREIRPPCSTPEGERSTSRVVALLARHRPTHTLAGTRHSKDSES